MRLADHLMEECGKPTDVEGMFSRMCDGLREAQRFELSDDVARAGYNLTKSKPTTLLSALPLCRAPYRKIWLEWRGGLTTGMVKPEFKRDPAFAPDPLKQGCLIETDESGQRGTMTFAWIHKARPDRVGDEFYTPVNICPLGSLFNWDRDADVAGDANDDMCRRYPTNASRQTPQATFERLLYLRYSRQLSDDDAKAWMQRSVFKDWGRFADMPQERDALRELGRHQTPFVAPCALGFFRWCAQEAIRSERTINAFFNDVVRTSWESDIEGEPPFAETIIAMMNSRNAVEHRPVDLSGLNKARAKRGRSLFLPYKTTHLQLSQAQTRAFRAGLLSREEAGQHRVRGHFKIRKTGIYWWHPFFRGDAAKPVQREQYKVKA